MDNYELIEPTNAEEYVHKLLDKFDVFKSGDLMLVEHFDVNDLGCDNMICVECSLFIDEYCLFESGSKYEEYKKDIEKVLEPYKVSYNLDKLDL